MCFSTTLHCIYMRRVIAPNHRIMPGLFVHHSLLEEPFSGRRALRRWRAAGQSHLNYTFCCFRTIRGACSKLFSKVEMAVDCPEHARKTNRRRQFSKEHGQVAQCTRMHISKPIYLTANPANSTNPPIQPTHLPTQTTKPTCPR